MQKGFLIAGILHVYVPGKPSTVLKSWWMSFAGIQASNVSIGVAVLATDLSLVVGRKASNS